MRDQAITSAVASTASYVITGCHANATDSRASGRATIGYIATTR